MIFYHEFYKTSLFIYLFFTNQVYIVPLKKWRTALNDVLVNTSTQLSNNDVIKIGARKFVYSHPGNDRKKWHQEFLFSVNIKNGFVELIKIHI